MEIKADLNKPIKTPTPYIILLILAGIIVLAFKYFDSQKVPNNEANTNNNNNNNNFQNTAPVINGDVTTINNFRDSNKNFDSSAIKEKSSLKQTNISFSVKSEEQSGGQTANTINNK